MVYEVRDGSVKGVFMEYYWFGEWLVRSAVCV